VNLPRRFASSVSGLYLSRIVVVMASPMCELVIRSRVYGAKAGGEGGKEEGTGMGRSSGRVILECEECGERLVLGDPDEVWLSTRTLFECECGHEVSLASRLEETERTGAPRRTETEPAPDDGV
jgi:hypothetical protein